MFEMLLYCIYLLLSSATSSTPTEHRITSKQAQISTIRDHKLVRKTRELRESYDKDDKEFFANRHTVFVEFCMQDLRDNFHKGKNESGLFCTWLWDSYTIMVLLLMVDRIFTFFY